MREKIIKLYKFNELSDEAKETAREWMLNGLDYQHEWEYLVEDAKNVGINLEEWDYRRYAKCSLELDFSQVLTEILNQHGESCETYKTAERYKQEYDKLTEDQVLNGEDEELREEFTKDIAEDYRILADNQYEYIQSNEYLDELLEINDYEFTEDGKIA